MSGPGTVLGLRLVLTRRRNRYSQRCAGCRALLLPGEGQLVKVIDGPHTLWEPHHRECAVRVVDEIEDGA